MLNVPVQIWFLLGVFSAFCGAVGGYGGRAMQTRMAFAEVWDFLDHLHRRLSKREGQAGREKVIENAKGSQFQQWAGRLRGAASVQAAPAPEDEGARVARARQVFGAVDKKPTGST